MKLLILGGTAEAVRLARCLAGDARFEATISLAGRTSRPAVQPLPTRIGGFGGADGLAHYLRTQRVDALVDATHPFAVRISRNATAAAAAAGIPLVSLRRPPWQPVPGDRWIEVADVASAVRSLGGDPRRVLLTIGKQELAPFASAPWHRYTVRSVDPAPPDLLPEAAVIAARGPFRVADEIRLLMERRIEVLVTKNSGGTATAAKLEAARALRLPVVMIARPASPDAAAVVSVEEALAWLERLHAALLLRGA
ncbi:MAG: cobalt-precorrin-6A reductase [Acidisphaera sp.]|nr:cobalt-precorrin-6A reductase [Acidisphaera sp.]